MRPFEVVWTDNARDALLSLPREVQARIVRKVEAAKADPFRYFQRLKGGPGWRLRVGDYRIVADIITGEVRVVIHDVGHRRNIYG